MALATPTDACREFARNCGAERPDRAWICTPYDTWEPNPYYAGPPQRHPEDYDPNSDPDRDAETDLELDELADEDEHPSPPDFYA